MLNRHLLDVAYGRAFADTIIENGQLVNVLTGEIYPADIAIADGRIAAVGNVDAQRGSDTAIIDAENRYLTPGLIDGHLHIECSKLSVTMLSEVLSRYGTTSVISGLDQILVAAGVEGVQEFLRETEEGSMHVWWGAPTRAPYTIPESNVGYTFRSADHEKAQRLPECVGLWETVQEMVEDGDEEVLAALDLAQENRLPVFGCAPLIDPRRTAGFAAAGVALCHESYSPEEELEKMRNGINIIIRESTAAPMLRENIKLITEMGAPSDRVGFCTDDITATDVLSRGHLDYVVRLAIECGVTPMQAIQMGTINTARMFRLDQQIGAIAPGRFADILFVDDLVDFRPQQVMKSGRVVAKNGQPVAAPQAPQRTAAVLDTFQIAEVKPERIKVTAAGERATVQAIVLSKDVAFRRPGAQIELVVEDGEVQVDTEKDAIMVAVAERYGKTGNLATAFVNGFGIKKGAIATSNAPDDNNIVVAGTNSADMALAINEVVKMGGGQIVVADGEVLARLPLPVGGIVADIPAEEMAAAEKHMDEVARKELGSELVSPFGQLLFLSITAIPEWAITDLGLIDCVKFEVADPVISVAAGE